jgi:hypothetical protein
VSKLAVRVRVRIESQKGKVETSALVNSGFETDAPHVIVPLRLAEKLGFERGGLKGEEYLGAGGMVVTLYPLQKSLQLSVVTDDKIQGPVLADASLSPGEREVILSDAASSALKISIDDLKEGIWRFSDESRQRRSVEKEEWI